MNAARRTVETKGRRCSILEAGEGPLVLLLHGFPDVGLTFAPLLAPLAAAGFHVVAPDARGCGRTPAGAEATTRAHVADACALVEALGERTAVVVGHDWGAVTAWKCAELHPATFEAVVSLGTPFTARPPAPPLETLRARSGSWK